MLEIVKKCVIVVCELNKITFKEKIILYGEGSELDSITFVQLIAMIEQELAEVGIDVVLVNDRVFSYKNSPFKNIGSIVKYIEDLQK